MIVTPPDRWGDFVRAGTGLCPGLLCPVFALRVPGLCGTVGVLLPCGADACTGGAVVGTAGGGVFGVVCVWWGAVSGGGVCGVARSVCWVGHGWDRTWGVFL